MALTSTTFSPNALLEPYIGPAPTQDLWNTLIPRAAIIFSVVQGAITTGGAGNEQKVIMNCKLPSGFAYAMREFVFFINDNDDAGDVDDWDDQAYLTLRDDFAGESTSSWVYAIGAEKPSVSAHTTVTNLNSAYKPINPLLQKLVIPRAAGGLLQFTSFNLVQDGGAMIVNAFARFLQYDLNQAYRAIVNTPVPTR